MAFIVIGSTVVDPLMLILPASADTPAVSEAATTAIESIDITLFLKDIFKIPPGIFILFIAINFELNLSF